VLICDVIEFTRHLVYQFSFHFYVEMHLFDVVDALDTKKIEKNEYFCIFSFLRHFSIFSLMLPIFSFLDPR
jgi:hypothetical protein